MTLLVAIVFGILVGTGVHLMVRRDALRLVGGTVLLTNAAVLFLMAAAFDGEAVPLLPIAGGITPADPLAQALSLTAIVIGFGTTVLLLRVALAVERTHDSLDMEDLVRAEVEEDRPAEREGGDRS